MKLKSNISQKYINKFNLALKLQNRSEFIQAIKIYKNLMELNTSIKGIEFNLSLCYFATENYLESAKLFHQLHTEDPDNTIFLNHCAVAYLKLNQNQIALEFLKRIVHKEPNNIEAWVNLTYAASRLNNSTDSLYYATQALSLNPKEAKLFNNMGSALQTIHRYSDAIICYETALELDQNNVNAITNIATVLDKQSIYKESIGKYEEALRLPFLNAEERLEIQYRMSFPLLASGSLELGWEYYDKGFEISSGLGRTPNRKFAIPQWKGERIFGKKLLIWREQGLGDEVWFFSLISDALKYCDNITIECTDRLVSLLQRAYPNCSVRIETPYNNLAHQDTFDYHIPAGSLCKIFRSTWDFFPPNKGYLKASPKLVTKFSSLLSKYRDKVLVGISWRSGNLVTTRNIHYSPISEWEAILKAPNIQFINLQYGDCFQELENVKSHFNVEVLNFNEVDLKNDLESVAAIISNLDLVISVSTFTSPFTQALGIPLKLINHRNWSMLGKDEWPWYEKVDIYCPENLSSPLNSVFESVANDLANYKKNGT